MGSKISKLTQTPKLRVANIKGFTVFAMKYFYFFAISRTVSPGWVEKLRTNTYA